MAEILNERAKIVEKLREICDQLMSWGKAHNVGNPKRAVFYRAAVYALSVELQALRDKEIEDLKRELENIKKFVGMV
mgnify:CR=1 FL=1